MIVFNRTKLCSFLQVLFKGASWIKLWSELYIQRGRERNIEGCMPEDGESNVGIVQQAFSIFITIFNRLCKTLRCSLSTIGHF